MGTGGFYSVTKPLVNIWDASAVFVPSFIAALIVFVVGLVIATSLGSIIQRVFETLKIDQLLKNLGIEPYFERAGVKLRAAWFLGQLIFWYIAIAFLLAASDILGLASFSGFLNSVLGYVPNIVLAVLIMLSTVVVANFLRHVARASVKSAKLPAAHFIGALVWWVVTIFGFLTVLNQLRIAPEIVNAIVTGLIAMLALAGGLAFGLGGRDYAAHLINKLRDHTESR